MGNNNTKYWAFTWDTNSQQKKLPDKDRFRSFMDEIGSDGSYQYERGSVAGKVHIQGCFTLAGARESKMGLLRIFREEFKNVSGLTLSKVYDRDAIARYVSKEETRVEGPFKIGMKDAVDKKYANSVLINWQQDLYDFLLEAHDREVFRSRKVIWIEDKCGNTGKSFFQKWLRIGQNELKSRKLPISSVDRLTSAFIKLMNTEKDIDLVTINLTRTRGEDQSLQDMFAVIEEIKDGYMTDAFYGKYNEAIYEPPLVAIFTNESFDSSKLSQDRWLNLEIRPDTKGIVTWIRQKDDGEPYSHMQAIPIKKYFHIIDNGLDYKIPDIPVEYKDSDKDDYSLLDDYPLFLD